ncbi:MAG: hypothetical protein JNJ73_12060 [Hyphomonadaceae bacterium]|nr:hypothetical protein [Hyphomonadaceae bacterium]
MHKLLVAGIAALLIACAPATPPTKDEGSAPIAGGSAMLGPEGYGPVRVGMTVEEAGAALGHALQAEGLSEDPQACQIYPDAGALYMAEQGRITRVSAYQDIAGAEGIRTAEGVGLGSSDAEVRSAYPGAAEEPAKYEGPPAHDLIAWTTPNERGIRFEIDASGKVVRMHAGGPSIMYMEGCS